MREKPNVLIVLEIIIGVSSLLISTSVFKRSKVLGALLFFLTVCMIAVPVLDNSIKILCSRGNFLRWSFSGVGTGQREGFDGYTP